MVLILLSDPRVMALTGLGAGPGATDGDIRLSGPQPTVSGIEPVQFRAPAPSQPSSGARVRVRRAGVLAER